MLLYQTNFVGADASLDTLSLDGKTWTTKGGGGNAEYRISGGNRAYLNTQGTTTLASATYVTPGTINYRVEALLHTHPTVDNYFGIGARIAVNNDGLATEDVEGYFLFIEPNATNEIELFLRNGGILRYPRSARWIGTWSVSRSASCPAGGRSPHPQHDESIPGIVDRSRWVGVSTRRFGGRAPSKGSCDPPSLDGALIAAIELTWEALGCRGTA